MNIKYKLGEVAKDLNKPNKEVIELLSKYTGEPRKSVSVLSEDELNYVFEYYTQKNQLENINDYFTATSKPPQPKQEKAPAPAKKKPAGEKGEKKEKAPEMFRSLFLWAVPCPHGGDKRDRTADLLNAIVWIFKFRTYNHTQ